MFTHNAVYSMLRCERTSIFLLVKSYFTLYFFYSKNDFVVETSVVGTILNGLSHLNAVTERGQFIVGLLRGLGGNVNFKTRQEFAKEVRFLPIFGWA